ncbi:MAG: glycosyltransferase [Alphaproteobacteria bacterium]|nr:glycosyltransferase [Alphaproteobacteria bacterium]
MTDVVADRRLAGYLGASPLGGHLLGWFGYAGVLLLLAGTLPDQIFIPGNDAFLLIMGVMGIWRYSWGAMHLIRSLIYQRRAWPRRRRAADQAAIMPPALYVLITSYRMEARLNAAVYERLLDEVAAAGVPAMIVACITDPADGAVLEAVMRRRPTPSGTRIVLLPQDGKGKRSAMAAALKRIQADSPPPDAQLVLMDGDTLLGRDSLARTCRVLGADRAIGAVTTDNRPLVRDGVLVREWYRLRMAMRHSLMCSLSLSRKLLVLTGRFSVFRVDLAMRPDFILSVESDFVRHRRLGRIRMVTGDDKSTWFVTLAAGRQMLYLPDVVVHPVEDLPAGGFARATTALMTRWYGNMMRNNGRALALGPRRCGWFLWACLIDQRLSVWTTLTGPTFALLATLLHTPVFIQIYAFWVLSTRVLYAVLLSSATGRLHPMYPLLLYYSQVVGSAVKVVVGFHLHIQHWTRQRTGGDAVGTSPWGVLSSALYTALAFVLLVVGVAWYSGVAQVGGLLVGTGVGY